MNGDIGAFLILNTEATVKYLDTILNKQYLIPANKNYENIEINKEISTGQHRKINLLKEPFNLDVPFYKIQEINNEHNPDQDNFIYIYKN